MSRVFHQSRTTAFESRLPWVDGGRGMREAETKERF
jgi:hypothetical protein